MSVEVFFEDIKPKIISEISLAKNSIFIAVAWFTDESLLDEIISKSKKGVKVQLLINDDLINQDSGLVFENLNKFGGMLYYNQSELMHNKFCIIDEETVINGSFNWTHKARVNEENITIFRNETTTTLKLRY
jgi:phosphatidylserine/phosphatidylglycerophosphate/cardiolipin synthase-like enzyme